MVEWSSLLKRFILISFPMLLLLNLGGCKTTENLSMHDSSVFFPSLRVKHVLSNSAEPDSENKQSRVAIELDADYASGTGTQGVSSSQYINFGGSRFNGPAEIKGHSDLYIASLLFRVRLNDPAKFYGVDLLGGASLQRYNLRVDSNGVSAEDATITGGPLLGFQFSVAPYSWADLYLRANGALGFGQTESGLSWVELGISVKPHPRLGIIAGFRSLKYWQGSLYSSKSAASNSADINLVLRGPVVGLQLEF
jgi:hypothetical protein